MKHIILEHHPNDSRIKIDESGKIQSLTQRMGTGGGNVPLVLEVNDDCCAEALFKRDGIGYGNLSDT